MVEAQKNYQGPPRHHTSLKKPLWLVLSVSVFSMLLICTRMSPRHSNNSSKALSSWLPVHVRKHTDEEVAARAVVRDILKTPPFVTENSKIAFLFLTPGTLPFEKLWDEFFTGHEGKFSIYIHPSKERPVHISSHFSDREIHSDEVTWGRISMVDAEKRLLVSALEDPDNQHFVLLSESCIPLHTFDYTYRYLLYSNVSFIESFVDPGPHGTGRHMEHMLPEIAREDFRKGAQWFTMKRQHAVIVMADGLYYSRFREYCGPGIEADKNCIADEHYLPTFFSMIDPMGISNWSVTYVDWSERQWHPKTHTANEISLEFMKNVTTEEMSTHVTSVGEHGDELHWPCTWNGIRRPCYLFARKFHPDTLDTLVNLFPNYTSTVI
ncbi:BnaA03g47650D [Brassica napus]|uniref:BnaA03g47650D protein n=2 Tax=Brassica napus TaxID=3708 RepID=A0A078HZK2_BRANA|nr:glycosyltransferase BC10 [Brassica napus]CDY42774.1 BnaA03g47650D [Brassica napus]